MYIIHTCKHDSREVGNPALSFQASTVTQALSLEV